MKSSNDEYLEIQKEKDKVRKRREANKANKRYIPKDQRNQSYGEVKEPKKK